MTDKQEFKVRVRQFADGRVFAMAHHEIDEGADMDDLSSNNEGPYREFDLVVRATPPAAEDVNVPVDVPDDADEVSVDVPDTAPA